jgi:hypothetical protein
MRPVLRRATVTRDTDRDARSWHIDNHCTLTVAGLRVTPIPGRGRARARTDRTDRHAATARYLNINAHAAH